MALVSKDQSRLYGSPFYMGLPCSYEISPLPLPICLNDQTRIDDQQVALISDALAKQGFCIVRGAVSQDALFSARSHILCALSKVDEITTSSTGCFVGTGRSERSKIEEVPGKFWLDITYSDAVGSITRSDRIRSLAMLLLQEQVEPDPNIYLRAMVQGHGTSLHADFPQQHPSHFKSLTFWMPLVDVALESGPLFLGDMSRVVPVGEHETWWEASERRAQAVLPLFENALSHTYMASASDLGIRFCGGPFRAGDVAIFSSTTVHGSFDNVSLDHRLRLSLDFRWEPAAYPHFAANTAQHMNPSAYLEFVGARALNSYMSTGTDEDARH